MSKPRPNVWATPFIKYVGGKSALIPDILPHVPQKFGNYHEPFVGGGAVFFALTNHGILTGKRVVLADINWELIETYKAVRDSVDDVIRRLEQYENTREVFNLVRAADPRRMPQSGVAARFIYLNKTCFNGLMRYNKKGEFNTPFGEYKNPKICDEGKLLTASRALQKVELVCCPFSESFERTARGDFVYADPPYYPLSKTANFTSYSRDGFTMDDHVELSDTVESVGKRGVKVLLSNAKTFWVSIHYPDAEVHVVKARRRVNSKGSERGPVNEVLIRNY